MATSTGPKRMNQPPEYCSGNALVFFSLNGRQITRMVTLSLDRNTFLLILQTFNRKKNSNWFSDYTGLFFN